MSYLVGIDRYQSTFMPRSLDELIDENNAVRVIDAFVDSIHLEDIGFIVYQSTNRGQRPYKRDDLLKIVLYSYMNKIRSSRGIEQECKRNIELMWLTGSLTPDHGTVSGFIKENKDAVKELFRSYVLLLKGLGFIDGELIAIDGTKIRASNAKNKHYNQNKINIKLAYYEQRIAEYLDKLDELDNEMTIEVEKKLLKYKERIERLKSIENELKEEKKTQVCLTDPDAKSMRNNGCFEPCFNVQTAVDSKHKLIVTYDVVNDANDQAQLKNMVNRAKGELAEVIEEKNLDGEKISFVLDTGYYNQQQIIECSDESTEILIKKRVKEVGKIKAYDLEKYKYNSGTDTYICPDGYIVSFDSKFKKDEHSLRKYKCHDYENCKSRSVCTKSKTGRSINRPAAYDELIEIEKNTYEKNDVYKRRGQIVEHPFGTIKRHLGFTHFYRRGFRSVTCETGLVLLVYNIKRTINILGAKEIVALLRAI